jgi:glutathione S-transferase
MVVAMETGLADRIETLPTAVAPTKPNDEMARENPLVKIPALTTDEGDVLFDSPVICEYLDSLHGGAKLFPAGGAARWTALRQQALGDGILDAAILCRYESLRPKEVQWPDWIGGQMRKVRGGLDALDKATGTLSGPLTIGQITVGCALGYLDFRFPGEAWRGARPALARWYEDFAKRPSMQATAPKE